MGKVLLAIINKMLLGVFLSVEKLNATFSPVGGSAFFDQKHFPWIKEVEAYASDIQAELKKVMEEGNLPNFQDVSPEQVAITTDDRWKTFFLFGYGSKVEENCARCPKTEEALSKIPNMTTAMFSIFSPQKHVPPHRGPYNGVLRYQLALKIPGDGSECGIRVGKETRHWVEGKSLVFDDSYEHEAWNKTDDTRVVLFVDFVRPLPQPLRSLNNWVIEQFTKSSFVTVALNNIEEWNRSYDEPAAKDTSGSNDAKPEAV